MTITKTDITKMREQGQSISVANEQDILNLFGTEPDDKHQWTQQDIHEQVRKILTA